MRDEYFLGDGFGAGSGVGWQNDVAIDIGDGV